MSKLTFKKLAEANAVRGVEWTGKPGGIDDLLFRAVELGGEVGEAQNIIKKLARYMGGHRGGVETQEAIPAIADELADIVICADRVAETLGIDLGIAVKEKFNKTSVKQGLLTVIK